MDFLFQCSTLWATVNSVSLTVSGRITLLTANLKQTFRETEWLNHPFRQVNVLIASKRFTFIPLEFFEDEQAEIIFYHNHPRQENEIVQYNILQKNNESCCSEQTKARTLSFANNIPVSPYPKSASFIEFFSVKSRLGNSRKMYAHLQRRSMELFAYERGRLLLANAFECKTTPDRIYYLLYVWKQLGFEQERDELHLTGNLHDKEQLLPELRKSHPAGVHHESCRKP